MNLNRLIVTLLTMFGLRALRRMGRGAPPRGPGTPAKGRAPQHGQQEAMRAAKRAARMARRLNR